MFLNIFLSVLAPLILVVSAGFVLGRRNRLDPTSLARTSFYLFNPALVFVSLAATTVAPELLGRLALLKILLYVILVPLATLAARRLNLVGPLSSAFVMAVVFCNSGNFGLPVNEFAFGKAGVALAVLCYMVDNLALNSLGVYLAARGRATVRQALGEVVRNPGLYAIPIGLLANHFHWEAPLPLARALDLLSRAAVPTMLMVLGLQLARLRFDRRRWGAIATASALRLVVSPLLAVVLTLPVGLIGLGRQVGIVQAAVPTAVTAAIVADRYDSEAGLVAGVVLITSLISLISMTFLLAWLT